MSARSRHTGPQLAGETAWRFGSARLCVEMEEVEAVAMSSEGCPICILDAKRIAMQSHRAGLRQAQAPLEAFQPRECRKFLPNA